IQESRSTDIWAVCASAVAEIPIGTATKSATAQLWSAFMVCRFSFRRASAALSLSNGRRLAKPGHRPRTHLVRQASREIAVCKREEVMRTKTAGALAIFASCTFIGTAGAQDLGPQVKKLADGVYVHTGRGFESNSGIILTQDGVIVIDTGQNPYESRNIWATVRNLTSMPVRFVIDTEPHADHTTGHYMFSPPAVIIAAAGAGESMRIADRNAPDRIQRLAATSPEFKAALEGYRFVTPHIEYRERMTINLGGRTLELIYLKG